VSSHPTTPHAQRPAPANRSCPANRLNPQQRQRLAIEALAGTQPVGHLADDHDVSRKFVYQQAGKAQQALDHAFAPNPEDDDQQVLFTIRVTKPLLRQIVLGLILICHSSLRGVVELLRDIFDFRLSVGTVANIVRSAVAAAGGHNDRQDLSAVAFGAHDEIFQTDLPVLVGVDVESTYCYLLSQQEHRDADTWGACLSELTRRGFHPQATIADFAGGLRAGQEQALPGVPCWGDVFHPLRDLQQLCTTLENKAYQAIATRSDLERQQATPGKRRDRLKLSLAQQLRHARPAETQAITLSDDVALLMRWLREDILSVQGPAYAERVALYDFLVGELFTRESVCPSIGPVRRMLKNQRSKLLAFAAALDRDLEALAQAYAISVGTVRELLHVQALPAGSQQRWQRDATLRQQLRGHYHPLSVAVAATAERVVRASSVAENLNSRLRCYFFLRRELGAGYLSLLQFFLNHRRFQRSERAERVGKSPTELLTGASHPHWLEMLGYQRFKCN
jgi:hypothetical protein